MSKQLDFVVSADGAVSLEASGFQGKACDAAAEIFIKALRAEIESKTYKEVASKASSEQLLEQKGG